MLGKQGEIGTTPQVKFFFLMKDLAFTGAGQDLQRSTNIDLQQEVFMHFLGVIDWVGNLF